MFLCLGRVVKARPGGSFGFAGTIHDAALNVSITPAGPSRYRFNATGQGADLTGTSEPVQVTLIVGGNSGTVSVDSK